MKEHGPLYLAWDGHVLGCYRKDLGRSAHTMDDDGDTLPLCEELRRHAEEGFVALWPMESLLSRCVCLPLKSPALVDGELLLQELADRAGIDPEEWWPCWELSITDEEDGVQGMVFAMPMALRERMASHPQWRHSMHLGVDGWHRLASWRTQEANEALLDEDADGLFLGMRKNGCWRGMRRLNGERTAELWRQARLSLQAMGFDMAEHPLRGQASETLIAQMEQDGCPWQGERLSEPLPRHHANLRCIHQGIARGAPNFRRGAWAARGSWQSFRPWLRSVWLTGLLLLLYMGGAIIENRQLESAVREQDARIMQAFHRGLPQEKIVIDPLAQLRRAAASLEQRGQSRLLHDLQALSESFHLQPWNIERISLQHETMQISGTIADIKTLNELQQTLEKHLETPVSIVDTKLGGEHLSFRLQWSHS